MYARSKVKRRGYTRRQAKLFLTSSVIIFVAAEIVAGLIDIWFMNNSSPSGMVTYNRWLSNLPYAISTGATVFLAIGLSYESRRNILWVISGGVVLAVVAFSPYFVNFLNITIEYSPGYYYTIIPDPISNLFAIGMGMVIAATMSYLLRDMLARNTGVEG